MKKIIRYWFIYFISLEAVQIITSVFVFSQGIKTVITVAAGLTVFELIIKPIVKLLLLPINILTLGLTRWVTNVVGLYLITLIVSGFALHPYYFPGINREGFVISSFSLSLIATYILISFLLNLSFSFIRWLLKK